MRGFDHPVGIPKPVGSGASSSLPGHTEGVQMAKRKKKKKQLPEGMDVIGRPGGFARAEKLTAARRKQIASDAANKRWQTEKAKV